MAQFCLLRAEKARMAYDSDRLIETVLQITPEMTNAGASLLRDFSDGGDPLELVKAIYTAMATEALQLEPPPADYLQPEWDVVQRMECWRNYVSDGDRANWESLTQEQRAARAREANRNAMNEEW